jgi:hypothetical protein
MSNVAAYIEVQSGRDALVSDCFEIRCNQEPRNAIGFPISCENVTSCCNSINYIHV